MRKDTGASSTDYFYFGSMIIAELNVSTSQFTNYVFFNGQRVAKRDPSGSVYYYLTDQVHSTSVVTDSSGSLKNEFDYYPWGGELQIVNNDPNNHYKFSSKERDSESQLDFFGARYYGNALGRFMTPDWDGKPVSVPYAQFGDPQSLNLYSYVRNSPITSVDPMGHNYVFEPFQDWDFDIAQALRGADNPQPLGDDQQQTKPAEQQKPQQPLQNQQQQQEAKEDQLVVTVSQGKTYKITSDTSETDVDYGVAHMDPKGNTSDPSENEQHIVGMTEKLDNTKTKGPTPEYCNTPCGDKVVGKGTQTDHIIVSGKHVVVLDKRFTIDGKPAKVINPSTGKPSDYIHQESTIKQTVLTYSDDSP